MKAEIVSVGTELLLGDTVNTSAAFIAKRLAGMGIELYHQTVVGDNPTRLKDALQTAADRSDLIITTGGLGPTYDDLTKETVAEFFGQKMQMNTELLHELEEFFRKLERQMTENNRKQAVMPLGAVIFPNPNGTACGLAIEEKGKIAIMLPGPPKEMEPMFEGHVMPYLEQYTHQKLVSHTIHVFGMGESAVEHTLKDLMIGGKNPTVAPYAKTGEVELRITAKVTTEEEAETLIAPVIAEIQEKIGDFIYGIDAINLENTLVKVLKEKNLKIAVAESCTGGYVTKRITGIAGASEVFDCGVCSYANEIKHRLLGVSEETLEHFGAVSEETAREMANGIRALAKADIGISVTGIAGPSGGTKDKPVGLIYIGVSSPWHSTVLEIRQKRYSTDLREFNRYLASSHALYQAIMTARCYEAEQKISLQEEPQQAK